MASDEKVASKPKRARKAIAYKPKPEPTAAVVPLKPTLRSDTETINIYMDLLRRAPFAPNFSNMEEVVLWLDNKYNKWLREVRHEVPL